MRNTNENMNGLIRPFFPKTMSFESITPNDIEFATHRLNPRPKNCLSFKAPREVFTEQRHSRYNSVTLQR